MLVRAWLPVGFHLGVFRSHAKSYTRQAAPAKKLEEYTGWKHPHPPFRNARKHKQHAATPSRAEWGHTAERCCSVLCVRERERIDFDTPPSAPHRHPPCSIKVESRTSEEEDCRRIVQQEGQEGGLR